MLLEHIAKYWDKKKTDLEKRKPLAIENSTDRYGVLENQNRIKIIGMSSFIPAQLSYASWAYILRMSVTEKKIFKNDLSQYSEFMSTLIFTK